MQVGRPPLGLLLHCLLAVAPAGEDAPRTGHWKQWVWLVWSWNTRMHVRMSLRITLLKL